jgi:hypothetical protein
MRKLVLAAAIAAFGLLVDAAWAAPVTITTTQGDVQKQCGNKLGCSTSCGGTSCDYQCSKGKKGTTCTVTINLVRPTGGGPESGGVRAPVGQ